MSFNTQGAVELPMQVFGSLVTEMAPEDLPEGVSPDNQDLIFAPGNTGNRPCLNKVFNTPFPNNATAVYGKTFLGPAGQIQNLYFDSNGILWMEDIVHSPGSYTQLLQSTPASYCKSVTCFGREYIAISDGLHGQEVPFSWDGTKLRRVTRNGPGLSPTVNNIILPAGILTSLARNGNVVTAQTSVANFLQPGYQVQISGVAPESVGGGITSIVIDNETTPGIATVTTATGHGLSPGLQVNILDVAPSTVASISTATLAGDIATIVTSTPHGLAPGASVTIVGNSQAIFNTTSFVAQVPNEYSLVFELIGSNTTGTGGSVNLNWPVPDTPTPTFFTVVAAPTNTTFQIAITYPDGTWTTGTVYFSWNGTFFVTQLASSEGFLYQQYGPNASTTGSNIGTATPYGQAAPGRHQVQLLFLTDEGAITAPSPPVTFVANGGQYLEIVGMLLGPGDVVARILAFTGAEGSDFYYIPVPAQINGQLVSTATQINDNLTDSIVVDFSDNTLYASLGISIPGNNLANQIVLDGALGFGYYASRLIAYGQRSCIQNLLSMSFDGGYFALSPNYPRGWNLGVPPNQTGTLVAGRLGIAKTAWNMVVHPDGTDYAGLNQPAYLDAYGAPIAQPNQTYILRAYLKPSQAAVSQLQFTALFDSPTTGFSSAANIPGTMMSVNGGWVEVPFSLPMPSVIPPDLIFQFFATLQNTFSEPLNLLVDEMSVIYGQNPYLDTIAYASYDNNPEGIDGVTGKFGAVNDTRKLMDMGVVRNSLYLFTQEPSGRLHETNDNGVTEPSGWTVSQVGANCGALSAFSLTVSQADDQTASGGEEWLAWASASGARIFGGDFPWKISQEIQPDWTGDTNRNLLGIDFAQALGIWALNDPTLRVIYFGVPSFDRGQPPIFQLGSPNRILVLNYRELDNAYEIAKSPPVHTSFSGRLLATDNTRKWTRWNMYMNGAAAMYRNADDQSFVTTFLGGNGYALGVGVGFGNVYTLNSGKYTDDDYGQVFPYYVTHAFPSRDQEQGLQLTSHIHTLSYLMAFISGIGMMTFAYFRNSLTNQWPLTSTRTMSQSPTFDMEVTGSNVTASRIFLKLASSPTSGTDNAFQITRLTPWIKPCARMPVRGSAY